MVRRLEDKGSRHQDGWKIAPRPSVSSHSHYVVHSENLPGFEDFPSGSAVNALRASDEVALQTPTSLTGESNVININLISDKFFYVFLAHFVQEVFKYIIVFLSLEPLRFGLWSSCRLFAAVAFLLRLYAQPDLRRPEVAWSDCRLVTSAGSTESSNPVEMLFPGFLAYSGSRLSIWIFYGVYLYIAWLDSPRWTQTQITDVDTWVTV